MKRVLIWIPIIGLFIIATSYKPHQMNDFEFTGTMVVQSISISILMLGIVLLTCN